MSSIFVVLNLSFIVREQAKPHNMCDHIVVCWVLFLIFFIESVKVSNVPDTGQGVKVKE